MVQYKDKLGNYHNYNPNESTIDLTWQYATPLLFSRNSLAKILNPVKKVQTTDEIINLFYSLKNPQLEQSPPLYEGERTYDAVLNHLGANGKRFVKINTPQRDVEANQKNLYHYLFENNPERLKELNKVKRTFETPSLIIRGERENKPYNYYAKPYINDGKIRGHLNIARDKEIGQFYQTNHELRKNQLKKLINNGQVTYNNLSVLTAPIPKDIPVTNIINDLSSKFNPSILYQKIQNLVAK